MTSWSRQETVWTVMSVHDLVICNEGSEQQDEILKELEVWRPWKGRGKRIVQWQ